MEIVPILSSLGRNKVGAVLIGLQIALTLAIVCNTLSLVRQHLDQMQRPSGLDEDNTFILPNAWLGHPQDLKPRLEEDLHALRSIPGVLDAEAANSVPLSGGGWSYGVGRTPKQAQTIGSPSSAIYFLDDHGLAAFGLKLIAGRWFSANEVQDYHADGVNSPSLVVVTRALARVVFPAGDALGQSIYMMDERPMRIIGIVDRAQTAWPGMSFAEPWVENSAFVPYLYVNVALTYVVRCKPGQLSAVMRVAAGKLYGVTLARIMDDPQAFAAIRAHIYRRQRTSSVMLSIVSGLLLTVTVVGVVGLTTYWVGLRRRQIGMRRALGARRVDILRYFHTENLLIAGAGALLGIGICLAGNLWLAGSFAIHRVDAGNLCAGAAIVLALSQLAVFWPALRAASISPAIAIRNL